MAYSLHQTQKLSPRDLFSVQNCPVKATVSYFYNYSLVLCVVVMNRKGDSVYIHVTVFEPNMRPQRAPIQMVQLDHTFVAQ